MARARLAIVEVEGSGTALGEALTQAFLLAGLVAAPGTCRVCGCTDTQACPGGCSWAVAPDASGQGVCSNCADTPLDPPRRRR